MVTKGTDSYRKPLEEGNPRRITDAKCAIRKMTEAQRAELAAWVIDFDKGDAK